MKHFLCEMYVKIYTDGYPSINNQVTPDQLYNYLTSDMGACFDDDGNQIAGDHKLWYFGCNEKFGIMRIVLDEKEFARWWGMGESSFQNVRALISFCLENDLFNQEQYDRLLAIVEEGERINDMYLIKDYLAAKQLTTESITT